MERNTNKVFDFIQRKVEYENFRFKYPSLIGVVLESITSRIIDTQKMIGSVNYRFHISESLTLGEIGEVLKFKINTLITDDMMKLGIKDKVSYSTLSSPSLRPTFSKFMRGRDNGDFYFPKFYNILQLFTTFLPKEQLEGCLIISASYLNRKNKKI